MRERSEILAGLADGGYGAIVTSKVLNEGVDIPEANVAVVVSGSASVREHVQRLGRILRARDGKRALLYELVTARTDRDLHQRAAAGPQCLPLIWSPRAGAATSCGWSPTDAASAPRIEALAGDVPAIARAHVGRRARRAGRGAGRRPRPRRGRAQRRPPADRRRA